MDSVPGSQDSITRVRNLQLTDSPFAAPLASSCVVSTPMPTAQGPLRSDNQKSFVTLFAVLSVVLIRKPGLEAQIMVSCCTRSRSVDGQQLIRESVAQLRQPDRAACVFCDTFRWRRCERCGHCKKRHPKPRLHSGLRLPRSPTARPSGLASAPNHLQPPNSSQPVCRLEEPPR